jgi:hypothetical protein
MAVISTQNTARLAVVGGATRTTIKPVGEVARQPDQQPKIAREAAERQRQQPPQSDKTKNLEREAKVDQNYSPQAVGGRKVAKTTEEAGDKPKTDTVA